MFIRRLLIAVAAGVVFAATAVAQDKSILVASTTSTQDSGLFGHLLPLFKSKTGIDVRSSRKAPARRSIPAAVAMPTSCSYTRGPRRKNSWRRDSASSVTR
jgi:hypothetical protein